MGLCRVCGKSGWVKLPWANAWFCREHFIEYFDNKVWRTYRKYVPRSIKKVLFTVSGGKDSLSMLYALGSKLFENSIEYIVLYVDLGIGNYSEYSLKIVEEVSSSLGVKLSVLKLSDEYGFTIDTLFEKVKTRVFKKPICSLCGVVKRYLFNKYAFENKYELVLTGHNLNDMYCFIMSNLVNGSLVELVKLKPFNPGEGDFVARAKPLYFNYEQENILYVKARNIPVVSMKCPYKQTGLKPLVDSFRKQLELLEEKHPGIGLLFLKNTVEKTIPSIEKTLEGKTKELTKCSICGYTSSSNPCGFCRIKQKI